MRGPFHAFDFSRVQNLKPHDDDSEIDAFAEELNMYKHPRSILNI